MTIPLPPGELQRLAQCVLEPIRFPGSVQRHGAVLVADAATLSITHASENTAEVFGADPVALLGRPLADLLDDATRDAVVAVLDPQRRVGNPVATTLGEQPFDLITHRVGDHVVLEFEPYEATPLEMTQATRQAMRRFTECRSAGELWGCVADELRAITGFDRVMVYHFHPDEHGEIVAESRAGDMESYLGLHYPASDIPAQARALYITKLSRMIVDSHAEPAALLADANQPEASSLDLSAGELRAVSPHHRQFMRNMGQTSTFSLSLVLNGQLVGMITCAHRTERRLPYNIRDGLEILANQVSLQLASMREIERLGARNGAREIRAAIVSQLGRTDDVAQALLHQHVTLRDLIPADGVAIRLGDRVDSIGAVPSPAQLEALGRYLARDPAHADLVSDALTIEHPDLAEHLPEVAGILVHRLGPGTDYLAWFRGELVKTVNWLGDMSPQNRTTILSPRNSFTEWAEEVAGVSEPWGWLPREAVELGSDVQATLLARAQSQLAQVALHDPLTGMPNRRFFMERLQHALSRQARGLALLFLDIDRFKAINDEFGHSAGDAALIHVAQAVRDAARATDTVARLGGDEFVLLGEGLTRDDAITLAERVQAAIAAEPEGSPGWRVSGSVGVALAAALDGVDASQLLSAADSAMYRAKDAGRGRVAI